MSLSLSLSAQTVCSWEVTGQPVEDDKEESSLEINPPEEEVLTDDDLVLEFLGEQVKGYLQLPQNSSSQHK